MATQQQSQSHSKNSHSTNQPSSILQNGNAGRYGHEYEHDLGGNGKHSFRSTNGIPNYEDDLDDPVALLERITKNNPNNNNPVSTRANNQFESLLQAAESAGGANARRPRTSNSNGNRRQSTPASSSATKKSTKRGRNKSDEDGESEPGQTFGFLFDKMPTKKKLKVITPEEEEENAREKAIWGSDYSDVEDEDDEDIFKYSDKKDIPTLDPRAAGVHGAAALFRKPTPNAKKYTRQPMSRLFTSLELSPEYFVSLQSEAKNYMLDERYPDRSASVGKKGTPDTDMAKLRMFTCAQVFLEQEGRGEKYFGASSPSGPTRKVVWPDQPNRLIKQVTPLLRRMVTNERQRLYAIEQRKDKDQQKSKGDKEKPKGPVRPSETLPKASSPSSDADLKPHNVSVPQPTPNPARKPGELVYHINVIYEGKRHKPCKTLRPIDCVGFQSLNKHIEDLMGEELKLKDIKILTANGMAEIHDEITWVHTVLGVRKVDWMDGDVRIVARAEKKESSENQEGTDSLKVEKKTSSESHEAAGELVQEDKSDTIEMQGVREVAFGGRKRI